MNPSPPVANRLLLSLPCDLLELIHADLERVELVRGQKLEQPQVPLEFVYFMEAGIASVIAKAGRRQVAVGIVGREGAAGSALAMDDDIPVNETFVQVKGSALRMPAGRFKANVEQHPALHRVMLRYARSLWLQGSFTSASNARLEIRLGRWLLMIQDRVGDKVEITHDFLALMLAARRPGVTVAIHVLEGERLLRSSRGCMVITDRKGLLAYVGDTYGDAERAYQRLIGGVEL